jgi:hypothetical protein
MSELHRNVVPWALLWSRVQIWAQARTHLVLAKMALCLLTQAWLAQFQLAQAQLRQARVQQM